MLCVMLQQMMPEAVWDRLIYNLMVDSNYNSVIYISQYIIRKYLEGNKTINPYPFFHCRQILNLTFR